MSKITKQMENGVLQMTWSSKGEKVTIDTNVRVWTYENAIDPSKECSGFFELTPDTMEVCECEGIDNMPKIVVKSFKAWGYDLSAIMLDEDEGEEDDDE